MNWNGKVNCITYEHFDEAMLAAQESEKRYKNGTARPLEGITVGIKDEFGVAGWRVTAGTVALKDAPVNTEDCPVIEMLKAAGAVLHIQTTVPEMYLNAQTWTKLWGVTRNPWNLNCAVGGSSGGSGAALAAGFATLCTGSDIGGSIRIPSSFCGVYGFKPPFGRVATSDTQNETYGPMARTFDDMVLIQNVIAGPHHKIHSTLRPKLDYPTQYESLKGVKIAVDYFSHWLKDGTYPAIQGGIDPAVKDAMVKAAEVLRAQGAIVDEIDLGWTNELLTPKYFTNVSISASAQAMIKIADYPDILDYTKFATKYMGLPTADAIILNDQELMELHQHLQAMVFAKGYTALIMPTLATSNIPADFDPSKIPGNETPVGIFFALTYPWNLLNRYPVVSAPIGINQNNMPMGMQIVGNTFDDLAAFRVAAGYAKAGLHLYSGDLFPDYRNMA